MDKLMLTKRNNPEKLTLLGRLFYLSLCGVASYGLYLIWPK